MHFAHSRENESLDTWQDLESHLNNVCRLARRFAPPSLQSFACIAGLWHDVGKYQRAFQQYIGVEPELSNNEHVPHSAAGAALVIERFGLTPQAIMLAAVIEAHHGALKAPGDLISAIETRGKRLLKSARDGGMPTRLEAQQLPAIADFDNVSALAVRMVFSALVDADLLDTEAWNRGQVREFRNISLETLRDQLDHACSELMERSAPEAVSEMQRALLQMRSKVYRDCVTRAYDLPGHFTLTVPTGGGKTLSGLAFALHHAAKHGKQRVIVVAPYTSILEQTADVYRSIFGDEAVIEHHSTIDPAVDTDRNRQACENWDAPIIVTTSVQLLESLHAAHKRPCRKLHRVANSVILLDEVQTFPVELLRPIHFVLNQLVDSFRVTVVHGTATQPLMAPVAADPRRRSSVPKELRVVKTEIMEEPAALFHAVRGRFRMESLGDLAEPLDPEVLAGDVRRQQAALVITHRRDDARRLAESLGPECLHLSAAMCAAHRTLVLRIARERLKQNQGCILVATQLVEAGVDIDFPVVYRALAGLETLAQAAGRCNRAMRLPGQGRFVVYRAGTPGMDDEPVLESKPPRGTPRLAMEVAFPSYFRNGMPDLNDPRLFPEYTAKVLALQETDRKAILDDEAYLRFPEVAEKFRMVDDVRIQVIAPYCDSAALVSALRAAPTRSRFRALQRYTVGVTQTVFESMWRAGWLEPLQEEKVTSSLETTWVVRPGYGGPYDVRYGFTVNARDVKLRSLQV